MRIGSLFSGAGGLDLAVQAVFGGEVVWHAEIDKAASKVLAYRWPAVPNLGDISAVDWAAVPAVDVLCGGFPCQDVSAAGKRAGIKAGTRSGLWSVFAEAIDSLSPQYVVIENVRGLLSAQAHRNVESADGAVGDGAGRPVLRAAGAVLGDLANLGYDAQWATVAAADVGAPHRRERVFILATASDSAGGPRRNPEQQRVSPLRPRGQSDVQQPRERSGFNALSGSDVAHSPRNGWDEGRPESAGLQRGFDAAVSGDGPVDLLLTPCVVDRLATTDMTLEQWDESRRSQKERGVGSFGPRGDSLGAAVLRVEEGTVNERPDYSSRKQLLPTPNADVGRGTRSAEGITKPAARGDKQVSLEDAVTLLPTPVSRDGKDSHSSARMAEKSKLTGIAHLLPTPEAKNSHAGPDYARMNREGSGGHDLVTALALLPTPKAHDGEFGTPRTSGRPIEKSTHLGTIASLEQTSHWGKYAPAIHRWEALTRPAPAPTEPNKNGNPRLSAAFSEWLMGWPDGWVTDPAIGISRNDQLRIVGNGVCPQQAAHALRWLLVAA